jgi:hypothetical protein
VILKEETEGSFYACHLPPTAIVSSTSILSVEYNVQLPPSLRLLNMH